MDLYDFPELYDALRAADDETQALIREVLAAVFPGGVRSLMDPACGPGNWLAPFAAPGVHLAGNDLSERMVALAREKLPDAEILHGDMRDLRFTTGPFDVALEAAGTACMLREASDFEALLATVESHVRPGGLVLLTIFFPEPDQEAPRPRVVYRLGPVDVQPAGRGWITYETVAWSDETRHERMRRTVRQEGVAGAPPSLVDEFDLRIWRGADFLSAVARTRHLTAWRAWRLVDNRECALRDDDLVGETLVALRRD
jgi:SAM-dependent methyltransferase